jgi:hypothetical protein
LKAEVIHRLSTNREAPVPFPFTERHFPQSEYDKD